MVECYKLPSVPAFLAQSRPRQDLCALIRRWLSPVERDRDVRIEHGHREFWVSPAEILALHHFDQGVPGCPLEVICHMLANRLSHTFDFAICKLA